MHEDGASLDENGIKEINNKRKKQIMITDKSAKWYTMVPGQGF